MMLQILGVALVATPPLALFVFMARVDGWREAMVTITFTVAVVVLAVSFSLGGLYLISLG